MLDILRAEIHQAIKNTIGRTFVSGCAYCETERVGFRVQCGCWISAFRGFDLFAQCDHCGRGIKAVYRTNPSISTTEILRSTVEMLQESPTVTFPALQVPSAPAYTPEEVANYFKQGVSSNRRGNWDAAGAMFRKSLEVALKEKFPDITERTLFDCIKKAAEQNYLTADLAEWANEIRNEGNAAMHDSPYGENQARRLEVLTDLILRYFFILPGMLKENRRKLSR